MEPEEKDENEFDENGEPTVPLPEYDVYEDSLSDEEMDQIADDYFSDLNNRIESRY